MRPTTQALPPQAPLRESWPLRESSPKKPPPASSLLAQLAQTVLLVRARARRARGQQRRRGLVLAQARQRRRRLLVVAVRHSCRTRLEAEVPPSCSCQTRLEAEAPPSSPALACVRASERQGLHRIRPCVRACAGRQRQKTDRRAACTRACACIRVYFCVRSHARSPSPSFLPPSHLLSCRFPPTHYKLLFVEPFPRICRVTEK
jgi:hypothetical protein